MVYAELTRRFVEILVYELREPLENQSFREKILIKTVASYGNKIEIYNYFTSNAE